MDENNTRRSFLRLTGLTGVGALLVTALRTKQLPAQAAKAAPTPTPTPATNKLRHYAGTSRKGDLKEAIGAAVSQVPVPCCDRVVEWKLLEVKGQVGGIDGRNLMTVTIEAYIQ